MTKTPDSPQRILWLDPFAASRQWMEIADKTQRVVSQYMGWQAESSAFQAYNPKATSQAFAEFFACAYRTPQCQRVYVSSSIRLMNVNQSCYE
jgi:hypothetical protein